MRAPILIQGAMEVETDWLVARLEGAEEVTLEGYRFWRGRCRDVELVISRTEIGELNTACATLLGIERFRPSAVLNQGIAGAHREDLHIGDIVVGESCISIDYWETPVRSRGEGSDPFTWLPGEGHLCLKSDATLLDKFSNAPYNGGRLVTGRLGSGDVFNREHDRIAWLAAQCGELCEDMESIAAYKVCHRLNVPCLGVRIISNNELTSEVYERTVGERLQMLILDTLVN